MSNYIEYIPAGTAFSIRWKETSETEKGHLQSTSPGFLPNYFASIGHWIIVSNSKCHTTNDETKVPTRISASKTLDIKWKHWKCESRNVSACGLDCVWPLTTVYYTFSAMHCRKCRSGSIAFQYQHPPIHNWTFHKIFITQNPIQCAQRTILFD